jgi:hypothetical protein
MAKFQCTSCGLCCSNIRKTFENFGKLPLGHQIELKNFPFAVKPDGSCEKLVNGKCKVYDKRPTICNVEKMHELHYKHLPQHLYFNEVAVACNQLMDEAGSKNERVKTKWIQSPQQQ